MLRSFLTALFFSLTALVPHPHPLVVPSPSPLPSLPSPTSAPQPLTFTQMNSLYGPCVYAPVLTYHHVQSAAAAASAHQSALTVYTDVFTTQMQYLANRSYTPITPQELISFFNSGTPLPPKPVLLTFDDGYSDFYSAAAPVLSAHNFSAVMFLPTGLVNNPDYLTWSQISSLSSRVYFGNHTWSHRSLAAAPAVLSREIDTAQTQLADHGLNPLKIFAYPYGAAPAPAVSYLSQHGYSLAFTTQYGSVLCARRRLVLPRIRISNLPLSRYGL